MYYYRIVNQILINTELLYHGIVSHVSHCHNLCFHHTKAQILILRNTEMVSYLMLWLTLSL